MQNSTLLRFSPLVLALLLFAGFAPAQNIDTLAFQDFELSPQSPVWTYTGTPNAFVTGNSSPSATPANSPLGIGSSRAWHLAQVSGGNPLVFDNQTIPSIYDTIRVRFRLAAMNLNGSSGGPDDLDYVLYSYSTDGGTTFVDRLRVRGAVNNNCSWPYSAAGFAQAYYLPTNEVTFQPVNSGLQVQDGLGTVELVFPGSVTQLTIRITPRSSSSTDSWLIDNLVLIGENNCTPTTATISPTACDSYTSPSGNHTWTSSNTYQDTIPNAFSCDSIITVNLTIINSSSQTITAAACSSYTSPSGNYVWTSSGTYTDTLTNAVSCDSIVTVNLTINSNSTSSLSQSACGSYLSPAGNVYTSSGTYTDTIPNAAGCDSVITIALTVNQADTSVSLSGTTLSANASGAVYQWIDCQNGNQPIPGATGQSFTPAVTGNFAVVVTENGCTDTSGCHNVTVVGLDESGLAGVRLWPNPAGERVLVDLGNWAAEGRIKVLDLSGRILVERTFEGIATLELDLAKLARGVYLVEVVADGKAARLRLLRE